ncbi:hypothetical protein HWV07_12190 [Natronomonas salina]|uniref:DUF7344 domain-containing protein n=1 Tax=Natronomonas salina TaxID=1710540 RepID=UPI0015B5FCA9|nr:hypothetical protein [Natronomonas salina]QLD89746.1 hypothetical protein HWV07_12190 [Natronomonas salina]
MEAMVGPDDRPDDPESALDGLSEDRIFSLLSAGRRRELLRALEAAGEAVPLSVLTREVALAEGIESDADAGAFKTVYVSLYQTHVPSLAAAGAVEYDPVEKHVELTSRAAPLFTYLDIAGGSDDEETTGLLSRFFGADHAAN